ncbi:kinase-like domain-containing protein [Pisolithus marmoratus]|nr:kinase-like domain-containing protein [Pisolithus marmoratus]
MPATPTKRTAEQPLDDERPSKRQIVSSPEEGEVDDPEPCSPQPANPPPPMSPQESKPKVKFPFKTRPNNQDMPPAPLARLSAFDDRTAGEDDRRMYGEEQRTGRTNYAHGQPRRRPPYGDHWEPSPDRRQLGWDSERDGYRHYRPPPPPPRDRYADRSYDRDRDRSASERSRSPSSTPRGKHRLPSRYSPPSFSPPPRNYDVDRLHDQRMREGRDRDRYFDDRYRPDNRFHYNDDRHYRPERGPRRDHSRERADDFYGYERGRYDRRGDDDGQPLRVNDYRPVSPGGDSYRPVSPCPLSPRPPPPSLPPSGPPPPSSSPPPVPPAYPTKDDTLPTSHAAVSIAMPFRRPQAPRDDHSPSPYPLPPAHEDDVRRAQEKRDTAGGDLTANSVIGPQRRRREPSDYETTTKLGEGTFGEVHKAIQIATGRAVALKRILMHNEKEGMPVTALREIKILKALRHPCIVNILDMFVVRSKGRDCPLSVYMVFPYMDHDLAGLLENERVKLQPSQIKLYMKQLLEGTEYMHRNHILHRDMKAANLLIDNSGSLRVADFGLARAYDPAVVNGVRDHHGKEKKYTNCVVTRWYRPPELLLGARQYGGEVDIWGIGLEKIWQLCGTPNQHTWPNFDALPGCEGIKRFPNYSKRLRTAFESIGPETCDLLDKLLTCNPRERITASAALDHDYFWTDPLPADPKSLPTYESSHEFDKRGRRNQPPPGMIPPENYRPHPPAGHPPYQGRHPPPREAFRTGPPPPPVIVSALMQGAPTGHPPHPPFNRMPPYPPPPTRHPGHPPRPALPGPPSHLPAKPAAPLGLNPTQFAGRSERDRGPRRGYSAGSGGHPPPSNGYGNGGGLPYGSQ